MYCRNCGEQMNENQEVCLKCGVKAGEGNSFCGNCGNATNPNAEICLSCGISLKKSSRAGYLNGQGKTTMILLCLFLGGIGLHNFMMGEAKKGVTKIVISLLLYGSGYILALIDLFKIASDTYIVDPNKFF